MKLVTMQKRINAVWVAALALPKSDARLALLAALEDAQTAITTLTGGTK
jgi:hypothetical protein